MTAHSRLDDLPESVRRFVEGQIDGVEQLDILLLLREASRCWDAAGVATAVRLSEHAAAMVESWFEHRGVLTNSDGTQDVGLGGASAYCRDTIRRLHD